MSIPSHPKTVPHFPVLTLKQTLFNFNGQYPPMLRPCPISSPHCLISKSIPSGGTLKTASAELVTFWGVTLVLTALSLHLGGGGGGGQRHAFDRYPSNPKTLPPFQSPLLNFHDKCQYPPTPRPWPLSSPRCWIYMTNVNTLPPQDLAPFPVPAV